MVITLLLAILGVVIAAAVVLMPELLTAIVLWVIYTNAAVVAYKFHGVPYLIAASVTLLLALPLAIYVVGRRRPIRWNPVLIPMFIVLCSQMISAIFAPYPEIAWAQVQVYVVEGLVLFFLVTNVLRTEEDMRRAVWALVLAGAAMGALVLFQKLTNTIDNDYGGFAQVGGLFRNDGSFVRETRQAGPLGEENNFATVMLVLPPLGWFLIKHARSQAGRLFAILCTGLIVVGIVLTFSRAAGTILLLMIPLIAYFSRTKFKYMVAAGLAGILLITMVAPDYIGRMASLGELGNLFSGETTAVQDDSLRGRASENLAAVLMFMDHPVVGVGEGNFSPLYQTYAREIAMDIRPNRRPHNLYLGVAAEGGMLGLLALLSVFFAVIVDLSKTRLQYKTLNPAISTLAGMLMVSIFGRMLMGLSLDLTYERYLWLLIAVAATVSYVRREPAMVTPTRELHRPLIPAPLSPDVTQLAGLTPITAPSDVTILSTMRRIVRSTDLTIFSSRRVSASDVTQQISPPASSSEPTRDAGSRHDISPDATRESRSTPTSPSPRPKDLLRRIKRTPPPSSGDGGMAGSTPAEAE